MEKPTDETLRTRHELHCQSCEVYARALRTLSAIGVPYLVGGGFAVEVYLDAPRARIKDLDVFLKPRDVGTALQALARAGFRTKLQEPQWLAKAFDGEDFVDLIFATRNGLLSVEDESFRGALESEVLGLPVLVQPVEEVLATKIFVCARDRFDVSDISHLILRAGHRIDWRRLIDRLVPHLEMLHIHLLLFRYIYPGCIDAVPPWAVDEVEARAREHRARTMPNSASRGRALDPIAFAIDIERWGFFDATRSDLGPMSAIPSPSAGAPVPAEPPKPDVEPPPRKNEDHAHRGGR